MIEVRRVESDADVDTWLAIRNEIDPTLLTTRAMFEGRQDRPLQLELLALLDGRAVGAATSARHVVDPHGPLCFGSIRVLGQVRRRGVGTALLAAVADHARSTGRSSMYTVLDARDGDSLDYFGKRGYSEVLRMQESVLDLARDQRAARLRRAPHVRPSLGAAAGPA